MIIAQFLDAGDQGIDMHLLDMGSQTAESKRCFLVAISAGGADDYDFNVCRSFLLFLGVKLFDDLHDIFRFVRCLYDIQILKVNAAFMEHGPFKPI